MASPALYGGKLYVEFAAVGFEEVHELGVEDEIEFGEFHAGHVVVDVREHHVDGADGDFRGFSVEGGAGGDGAFDGGALFVDVGNPGGVNDLFSRAYQAGEGRFADLGEDDFFLEIAGGADEDAGRLGHAFDHQRGGHDGESGEMIVQVIFGEGDVFDRHGGDVDLELFEFIDPDPAHGGNLKHETAGGALVVKSLNRQVVTLDRACSFARLDDSTT
jgi:hypothetical protein